MSGNAETCAYIYLSALKNAIKVKHGIACKDILKKTFTWHR